MSETVSQPISNSGLGFQFLKELTSPSLKIDRVTMAIKTKFPNFELNTGLIRDYVKGHFDYSAIKTEMYRENYKLNGALISFFPEFETDNGIRIEFNPKELESLRVVFFLIGKLYRYKFTNLLDKIKINRIDIAIDYPNNLNPSMIDYEDCKKSFYAMGTKGIESIYFGSRTSEVYFRIYNKKIELEQKQKTIYEGSHLWRMELELKKSFYLYSYDIKNYFDRIKIYELPEKSGDWVLDLIIHKMKDSSVRELSGIIPNYNTRKSYEEKLSVYKSKLTSPGEIFNNQFSTEFDKIKDLFSDMKDNQYAEAI